MHPTLDIPTPLLGVALILVGVFWCWYWRRKVDVEEREVWKFGLVLGGVGCVFLPGFFSLPPWPTYGVMMATGCLAVTVLSIRWSAQRGLLKMDHMLELLLLGGLCGLFGARAVFLVERPELFADQPPVLRVPGILEALDPGDTLEFVVHGKPATVSFQGDETTLSAVRDRIAAEAGGVGVLVSVVAKTRRTADGLATVERGLLLETERRGPEATLKVKGGSAVAKLGLDPMIGQARGVAVPLSKVFDLRMGGLTYFGSVFGVLTFSFFYLRFRKVSILAMLDVVAPVLPLGLFFGRLGCFSRGCCWGREVGDGLPGLSYPPWSLPWQQMAAEKLNCGYDVFLATQGRMSEEVRAYLGPYADLDRVNGLLGPLAEGTAPLHAAQLYEGGAVFLIFLLVWAYRERLQTRVGMAFALLVLLQTPVRFVVEHLRRDHEVFVDLGYAFTESQLVALVLGVGAVGALAYLNSHGQPCAPPVAPEPEAPPESEPQVAEA